MACGGDALPLWWPTSFSYMVDSLLLVVMGCVFFLITFFFTFDECQWRTERWNGQNSDLGQQLCAPLMDVGA
jgi:hypothetical protein